MLHPLHSRYVPDPSKQAIDLSWSFLRILPTCTISTRWTWLFRGDFPTFPSNPCMAVSCPPVFQRLELGAEAYVETPHRMNICYTISLSTTVQYIYIYQYIYISIYYNITCHYYIRSYRLCGCLFSVCLCMHMYTRFYCKLFDEQPWFPGGWCGPDRCADRQQRACSIFFIFFRNTGTTSINFPVWYHRWWSNLGEFQRHENTAGLSFMGCADSWWWGFNVWQCLYLVPVADLSCLQIGDVWWKHVHCNNLSFDLVHCGGIVFFPSPSLLRQLPENYSAFPGISGRLFLKIHSDGFTAPLQLVFLPFLTKFLMKGLVRWVLPVCYCMEYCPLEIT